MLRSVKNYSELASIMEPSSSIFTPCLLYYESEEYWHIIIRIRRRNFTNSWEFSSLSDNFNSDRGNWSTYSEVISGTLFGWVLLSD